MICCESKFPNQRYKATQSYVADNITVSLEKHVFIKVLPSCMGLASGDNHDQAVVAVVI